MRLILLTALAMMAFAANSVLNRMAVGSGLIAPFGFALVRLIAGAVVLAVLVAGRALQSRVPIWPGARGRVAGVLGLITYLLGFSAAYLGLPAGVGALILFGVVQITMFGGALLAAETVPLRRWAGAVLAFVGLLVLLAPIGGGISVVHGLYMAVAGVGWGIYSLAGRGQRDALAATAANFGLGVPVLLLLTPVLPMLTEVAQAAPKGIWLAVASGALTSGLGYALWYRLMPELGAARAAVAQLTVPVIAAGAGLGVLGEAVSLRFGVAAALVLGGVALASRAPR